MAQVRTNRNLDQWVTRIHRDAMQLQRMRLTNADEEMRHNNLLGFQIASQDQIPAQTRVNCFGLPKHQTNGVVLNSVNGEGVWTEVKSHIGDADDGEDFEDERIVLGDIYRGKN